MADPFLISRARQLAESGPLISPQPGSPTSEGPPGGRTGRWVALHTPRAAQIPTRGFVVSISACQRVIPHTFNTQAWWNWPSEPIRRPDHDFWD
eukprot:scaffold46967_cov72-Phaeocystis_antarctica.AAC.3